MADVQVDPAAVLNRLIGLVGQAYGRKVAGVLAEAAMQSVALEQAHARITELQQQEEAKA